jgi:hypothetical protein
VYGWAGRWKQARRIRRGARLTTAGPAPGSTANLGGGEMSDLLLGLVLLGVAGLAWLAGMWTRQRSNRCVPNAAAS